MPRAGKPKKPESSIATLGFEAKLWLAADKLCNKMDESEYKHVVLPPKPIASSFTRDIQLMLDRIHANLHQSRILAALRDTLLPKLLSGELRVADMGSLIQTAD